MGYHLLAVSNRGTLELNIWLLGKEMSSFSLIVASDQHITFSCIGRGKQVVISVVYASTQFFRRRTLSDKLEELVVEIAGAWNSV